MKNCVDCKYCDLENITYSKFVEGYVSFKCSKYGITPWIYTKDEVVDEVDCFDYKEKK